MISYISQIILFILAVLGTWFKTIEEDDKGKAIHSRFGFRVPTRVGVVILILAVASFGLSIATISKDARNAEERQKKSDEDQARLQKQLEDSNEKLTNLGKENSQLRDDLGKAQGVNIQGFRNVLEEQDKKHKENLSKLSSLLTQQQQIGENTARRIDKSLSPLTSDLTLSVTFQIPSEQAGIKHFIDRIMDQAGPGFAGFHLTRKQIFNEELIREEIPLRDFFRDLRIVAMISLASISPSQPPDLTFELDSTNIHDNNRDDEYVEYERSSNGFSLTRNIKVRFERNSGKITSLLEFPGSTLIIVPMFKNLQTKFNLVSASLNTSTGRRLTLDKFDRHTFLPNQLPQIGERQPVLRPLEEDRSFYVTVIPTNANW